MRLNRFDLNLLVALDAMLTERSISRAAQRLHVSQPAMSNALARLRESFGDPLLVQVGRRMELTPRAEALVHAVRDVLVRADATISSQPQFDTATADRNFRLLLSDLSTVSLMPRVIALAEAQAPRVRFSLLDQRSEPQRLLERGEADLLLIPGDYCSPEHPSEHLFEEGYACAVWQGNTAVGKRLTMAQYLAAGHVAVQTNAGTPLAFDAWFERQHGGLRRIEVTTPVFTALPALVVGTQRVATIHARLAHAIDGRLPIRLLKLPFAAPKLAQSMQWHQHRSHDPGLTWLRGLMRQAAADMDSLSWPRG